MADTTKPIPMADLITSISDLFAGSNGKDGKPAKDDNVKAAGILDLVDKYKLNGLVATARTYPALNAFLLDSIVEADAAGSISSNPEDMVAKLNKAIEATSIDPIAATAAFLGIPSPPAIPGVSNTASLSSILEPLGYYPVTSETAVSIGRIGNLVIEKVGSEKIAEEFFRQTPPQEFAVYIVQNANADQASVMLRRAISYKRFDHFNAILDAVENGVDGKKPDYTAEKLLQTLLKPENGVDIDFVAERVKDNAELRTYVAGIKAARQPAPAPEPAPPETHQTASATGTRSSLLLLPIKLSVDQDALPDGMDAEQAADALRTSLQESRIADRAITSVNPVGYAPLMAAAFLTTRPSAFGAAKDNIDSHAGDANYKLAMSVEKDKDGKNFISVFLAEPNGGKDGKTPTRIYYAAVDPEYSNATIKAMLTAGTAENKQFAEAVTKSLAVAFDDPAKANKQWGTEPQAFQLIDREAAEQSDTTKYLAALKAAGVSLVGTAGFAYNEVSNAVREKMGPILASARTSIESALASNEITPEAANYLLKEPNAITGLSLKDLQQLPAALADKGSELYAKLAEKVSTAGFTWEPAETPAPAAPEAKVVEVSETQTDAGIRKITKEDQLLKIAKDNQADLSKIAEEAGLSALVSDKDKAAMARWAYVFAAAHENGFKTAKQVNNLVVDSTLDLPEKEDIEAAARAMAKLKSENKKITYAAMEEILPPVTPQQMADASRTPD
ncbi:MAG: hypothetical protein U1E36_05345 [Rickettsiales bacterium]